MLSRFLRPFLDQFVSLRPRIPRVCVRPFSKSSPYEFKTTNEYDLVSNRTLDALFEDIESLSDQDDAPAAIDVEFSNGVLTLKLGPKGTYVINRQPPNRQIWLSSPLSGPKRYDYDQAQKQWVYQRDGTSLHDLLKTELSRLLGQNINLRKL